MGAVPVPKEVGLVFLTRRNMYVCVYIYIIYIFRQTIKAAYLTVFVWKQKASWGKWRIT